MIRIPERFSQSRRLRGDGARERTYPPCASTAPFLRCARPTPVAEGRDAQVSAPPTLGDLQPQNRGRPRVLRSGAAGYLVCSADLCRAPVSCGDCNRVNNLLNRSGGSPSVRRRGPSWHRETS